MTETRRMGCCDAALKAYTSLEALGVICEGELHDEKPGYYRNMLSAKYRRAGKARSRIETMYGERGRKLGDDMAEYLERQRVRAQTMAEALKDI